MLDKIAGAQVGHGCSNKTGVQKDFVLGVWERLDAWLERQYKWFFGFVSFYLVVQITRALLQWAQ
ncbi:hypothetical protein V3F56_02770 [Moorellaceae bacterium AZ2]